MVMTRHNKFIGLVKAEDLEKVLSHLITQVTSLRGALPRTGVSTARGQRLKRK